MEITVTAKTYDEAITEALLELQTTTSHLDVTVIEEGSEGLFGVIGGKPWVIRAKALTDEELEERERKANEPEPEVKEEPEVVVSQGIVIEPAAIIKETVVEVIRKPEETEEEEETEEPEANEEEAKRELIPVSEEEAKELIGKAVEFLNGVFDVMGMTVNVDTDFNHDENELSLVLSGDDMGVLIGKRGQTLDSLQYLTSLVVNKHHDGYIRVKLDSENYRERRQAKLEELAHNIAHKVSRTKKSVDLEPMNPYERRIIHSALQDDPYVTTMSEGEDPYRHVVIILKKGSSNRRRKTK